MKGFVLTDTMLNISSHTLYSNMEQVKSPISLSRDYSVVVMGDLSSK